LTKTTEISIINFTLAYTNTHGLRGILYTAYLVLAVVAVLGPTDLIVKEVRLEYYGYAPVIGPLTPLLFICYIALGIGAIYTLFKAKTRLTSYIEKNRITYLAIAGVFMIVGDILDAFSPLPPMGLWCYLVFCSLCTVAVLKYHLLDVSLVVRKGLVYLILSLMVATPYVAILYVAYFTFHAALEPWWAHAIIVMLLAIFLRPLYRRQSPRQLARSSWTDTFFSRS